LACRSIAGQAERVLGETDVADKPKDVEHYRQTFYEFSGKASNATRQLAFAAIAVIWLFKKDAPLSIPYDLFVPGILVVAALTADLLQYSVGAGIWYTYYRYLERKGISEITDHSAWLERPIRLLFWIKIALVILAYFLILRFLLNEFGLT
jgi:hypothetical protein